MYTPSVTELVEQMEANAKKTGTLPENEVHYVLGSLAAVLSIIDERVPEAAEFLKKYVEYGRKEEE